MTFEPFNKNFVHAYNTDSSQSNDHIYNDRLTRWACSNAAHVLISSQNIYSKILGGVGGWGSS